MTIAVAPDPNRPTLFDAQAQRPLTLKERFSCFHIENPQVYQELERMTQQMVDRGRTKLSIKTLVEVLRWGYYLRTSDPSSEFKLNNSYSAFYSRLLMDNHKEWGQIFELREIHEDRAFLVRVSQK
jgi:hypothetical protein